MEKGRLSSADHGLRGACFVVENRAKATVLGGALLWVVAYLRVNTPLRTSAAVRKVKCV